ncbi:hypothetical protein CEUSTIGMA_g1365.t1 [Chlamydomonas eustigma]|uniref:Rab-GAP TBC domain-containing protein n=1 Tax=Chlamydomonas eustigma TaxID=1157962 RepID=A0A250WSW2_9CHLO|nr:hypothetical protein CEUSTIGMA_g1365.t1 [Chlamydomonas eustigma]|eukprot:GAX73915.1 hypothetical protein CEUSTIGMA_g1365.t1 [Chlamydomonas eustigma]
MPSLTWKDICENSVCREIHDNLKEQYLRGDEGFQLTCISSLEAHLRQIMEKSGHATYIENLSFAVSEQIAFASILESHTTAITFQDDLHEDHGVHSGLKQAQMKAQAFFCQKLREIQLLTHWTLTPTLRPQSHVDQICDVLESPQPWDVLGEEGSAVLGIPQLPSMVKKDLIGHIELLLALAGQLNKDSHSISGPAARSSKLPLTLGMVQFLPPLQSLQPLAINDLRAFLSDLQPQERHVGIDDRQQVWFKDMKLRASRALLKEGSALNCRSFLRFGCPQGSRAKMWESALCLPPLRTEDVMLFAGLCRDVLMKRSVTDVITCSDVQSIADTEHFFLFEEMIRAVLLALSRDQDLMPCLSSPPFWSSAISGQDASSSALTKEDCVSTSHDQLQQQLLSNTILPVQGIAFLVAPLCYLYEHPADVYRLFRSMYARFWCKLHSMSCKVGNSPALPGLIRTYEHVLQELDPEIVVHLHGLGLPVAAVAMPWICTAFVGGLRTEEVLLLWDRILGLDSLLPLPLMAVAILCFRRQVILACQSKDEVHEVLSDISQLQSIPLLQALLFQG